MVHPLSLDDIIEKGMRYLKIAANFLGRDKVKSSGKNLLVICLLVR